MFREGETMSILLITTVFVVLNVSAFPQNNINQLSAVDGFVFDGPVDSTRSGSTVQVPRTTPNLPVTRQTSMASAFMVSSPTVSTTMLAPTSDNPPGFDACVRSCPKTPEYNPVCGSDNILYDNPGTLGCAARCGKTVLISHYGPCGGNLRG